MFNPLGLFSKLVKSNNQKELDRIDKIVQKINSLEENVKKLEDNDFPKKLKNSKKKSKMEKT